jgi:hypothetical protein
MSCFLSNKANLGLSISLGLLLSTLTLACGSNGSTSGTTTSTTTGTGGGTSTTGTGGSGTGGMGTGGSGTGGTGTGGAAACAGGHLCFDVKLLAGAPIAGRLGVVWFQLNDDGPDPLPVVAYDKPFDPAATTIDIPLADIAIPNEENLLCPRACNDESTCPCTGDPKLGVGAVAVVADLDEDGKLDVDDVLMGGVYGGGYMIVGYSPKAENPVPAPYDGLFPEGVGEGVLPYRIIPKGNGTFDAVGKTKPGDVFDLNVCDAPGTMCEIPGPNLS